MNLRSVDLNLLKVFHAVYQEQSLSRAADLLCLSQPAASHALNRFREVVGDPLFIRRGNRMLPTARAQELAEPIQAALDLIRSGISGVAEFDFKQSPRTFHLAMGDYSEVLLLPKLMAWVSEHCEAIDFRIHSIPDDDVEALLATGRLDLVIDFYPVMNDHINRQLLLKDDFVTVMAADYGDQIVELTLEKFLSLSHITQIPRQKLVYWIDEELASRGLERRIALQTQSFLAIPNILRQTGYLHTPPRKIAEVYLQNYDLRCFELPLPNFEIGLQQYWHRQLEGDVAHQWLRELVFRIASEI